jgi:hypothetical protein
MTSDMRVADRMAQLLDLDLDLGRGVLLVDFQRGFCDQLGTVGNA